MEKYNDLIKHEAKKLRIKHRMNELTEMECEDFVRGLLRQALIIDSVSVSSLKVCTGCSTINNKPVGLNEKRRTLFSLLP